MRHRGSGKIKLEHHLIPGLRKLLERVEDWEEIISIVPGEIRRRSSFGKLTLAVQYTTSSGIKCLAKSGGQLQEVYFVTHDPIELERKLKALTETVKT